MQKTSDLIVQLSKISNEDKYLVGEYAASLGEMLKHGFPFPNGFVITQNAYRQFALKRNLPDNLIKEIFRAYKRLESPLKDATVEIFLSFPPDSKNIPFTQKKETAKGEAVLLEKIKSIWAKNPSSIVICKIPQTSNVGVMFTIDPTRGDKTKILIYEDETENHYEVLKKDLKITFKAINTGIIQRLTDKQIVEIATLGKKLQEYCYFPQEICFAVEKNKIFITRTKPITILDTVIPAKAGIQELTRFPIKSGMTKMRNINNLSTKKSKHKILLKGEMLYPGIATGHLRIIQNTQDINKILRGEVIVIPYQDLIKRSIIKAGAIVATDDRLHQTSYLTLGRFFSGKPTIITTPQMAKMLRNGTVVTVNSKKGEVYMGSQWQ